MCFIGNDLLYIQTNKTTFLRKGAKKIILNKFETDTFFFENITFVLPVIWTIKESIYKITCKQGNNKAFTPSNITITHYRHAVLNQVQDCSASLNNHIMQIPKQVRNDDKLVFSDNNIYGKAVFEEQNYFFQTIVKQNYIFSYATTNENNFQNIKHHFFRNNAINNKSLNNVEFIRFIKSQNWNLAHSENGIPIIKNVSNIDISISHDCNILALSYILCY